MKALVAFLAVSVVGFAAHSMLPVTGGFVSQECGATVVDSQFGMQSGIDRVCIGRLTDGATQFSQPAVVFHMPNGATKTFRIARVDNLLIALVSGKTKSNIFLIADDGEQASMKVIKSQTGLIESAQGQVSGLPFFVKTFEPMFHPM